MKRITKVAVWFGIAIMTLTALAMIYVALGSWRATRRLNQEIADIRAAGDPVELSDLHHQAVPADDNAWTYLQRTHQKVTAITNQLVAVMDKDGPYRDGGRLNEDGANQIRDTLQQYGQVLPDLREAAARTHYDPGDDYTRHIAVVQNAVMRRSSTTRSITRLLMLHAELELFEGRREEALQTALLGLRLARQAERELFITSFTVYLASRHAVLRMINQILLDGPLAADSRLMLEKALVLDDDMSGFNWAIKSERVFVIAQFKEMNRQMTRLPHFANWETETLDMMQTQLELGAAPSYSVVERSDARQSAGTAGSLAELSSAGLQHCRVATDRVRALQRCLHALSTMQRGGEGVDRDALRVEDLGVPPPLTIDPFSGNPLLTLNTTDGWYIYSVGEDGDDDRASLKDGADIGAGPWQAP